MSIQIQAEPKWITEPHDVHVVAGNEIKLVCKADGLPKPSIKWISSQGFNMMMNMIKL